MASFEWCARSWCRSLMPIFLCVLVTHSHSFSDLVLFSGSCPSCACSPCVVSSRRSAVRWPEEISAVRQWLPLPAAPRQPADAVHAARTPDDVDGDGEPHRDAPRRLRHPRSRRRRARARVARVSDAPSRAGRRRLTWHRETLMEGVIHGISFPLSGCKEPHCKALSCPRKLTLCSAMSVQVIILIKTLYKNIGQRTAATMITWGTWSRTTTNQWTNHSTWRPKREESASQTKTPVKHTFSFTARSSVAGLHDTSQMAWCGGLICKPYFRTVLSRYLGMSTPSEMSNGQLDLSMKGPNHHNHLHDDVDDESDGDKSDGELRNSAESIAPMFAAETTCSCGRQKEPRTLHARGFILNVEVQTLREGWMPFQLGDPLCNISHVRFLWLRFVKGEQDDKEKPCARFQWFPENPWKFESLKKVWILFETKLCISQQETAFAFGLFCTQQTNAHTESMTGFMTD